MWDDPDLTAMDRLSMRYMGEPRPERNPCVSALVAASRSVPSLLVGITRWHTYGLLSEASDYSSTSQAT
jgi:hypothetical protein